MKLPTASDLAVVGFINNTFSYNPQTQGAIGSIDTSVDKKIITNIPVNSSTTFNNTFRPLIEQDGTFFPGRHCRPHIQWRSYGWNTISQNGLQATDFTQFNFSTGAFGTTHPDFDGDQMLFGLGQLTQFGVSHVAFKAIYDNLTFKINPAPDSRGTVLLLLTSAAFLFLYRTTLRRA